MFTELVPSVHVGPIELQIDAFAFIPLALVIPQHDKGPHAHLSSNTLFPDPLTPLAYNTLQ